MGAGLSSLSCSLCSKHDVELHAREEDAQQQPDNGFALTASTLDTPRNNEVDDTPAAQVLWSMSHLMFFVWLTTWQYAIVAPSAEYATLTFFAERYSREADCELAPKSEACRRAASDASVYHGISKAAASVFAFALAVQLGSASDILGRRPVLQTKAVISAIPIVALLAYIEGDLSLWWYLIANRVYEAFDIHGVILACVCDVVEQPKSRVTAFGLILGFVLANTVLATLPGGILTNQQAVWLSLGFTFCKLVFSFVGFPETAPFTATEHTSLNPFTTLASAWGLLTRNGLIARMVVIVVLTGTANAGMHIIISPYFTAFLGFSKAQSTQVLTVFGASSLLSLAILLRPAVSYLHLVGALKLSLVLCSAYFLGIMFSASYEQIMLVSIAAGPKMLQWPIISTIKAALVGESEQGLMQGGLASIRVFANVVAYSFFGYFWSYTTHQGVASDRTAAYPSFLCAFGLVAAATFVSLGLPSGELPPPCITSKAALGEGDPLLPHLMPKGKAMRCKNVPCVCVNRPPSSGGSSLSSRRPSVDTVPYTILR
eukprot:TRINITY_DN122632_c0_g1_i1.p1 TRINITY_DN122632_c0_g1~~TRINITY_DN122632_c0_g1_i1.p1  ORF type:complete len:545 (+),score=69.84 TRINITY_DN122632_c0_g1_i1:64-1698(+)